MNPNQSQIIADHSKGSKDALFSLIEYGDFECPYCAEAYPNIKKVEQELGDELYFIFRQFPLSEIHPNALRAALASEAAGIQGKFWEMHDLLFEHQNNLSAESVLGFADQLNLDIKKFQSDMTSSSVEDKIERDMESGNLDGAEGTPTFIINGELYSGPYDAQSLISMIKDR